MCTTVRTNRFHFPYVIDKTSLTLLWSDEMVGPVKEVPRLPCAAEATPPLLPCFCCFREKALVLSLEKSRLRRSLLAEVTEAAIVPRS